MIPLIFVKIINIFTDSATEDALKANRHRIKPQKLSFWFHGVLQSIHSST